MISRSINQYNQSINISINHLQTLVSLLVEVDGREPLGGPNRATASSPAGEGRGFGADEGVDITAELARDDIVEDDLADVAEAVVLAAQLEDHVAGNGTWKISLIERETQRERERERER